MNDAFEGIEFKQVERKRKVRKKKHYLRKFLILVALCIALYLFLSSDYFTVKKITVQGSKYYTQEEVTALAGAKEGGNLFFDENIKKMKKRLEKDPYFESVKFKRIIPDALVIQVTERPQTAAIIYGDQYVVIDGTGLVLRKTDIDPEITALTGLTISKLHLGEKVEAEESESLKTTLEMISIMKKGDLFFKKIDVSKVIIKAYIYDNLIVKGTPKQIMESIENGYLQKVVSDLFENGINRGTINMGGDDYMSFSPETQ